jgi:ketosteroid isomerase-like protein
MRGRHLRNDAEGANAALPSADRRSAQQSDGPIEKESPVSLENEKHIRKAYQAAEEKDIEAFIGCFTDDGTFTDQSIGVTYRGTHIGDTVTNYGTAFPDMHRELYQFYSAGHIVVVQLALQGTHRGPLKMPGGTIPPTGKRMDAPCADVFELVDGKIKRFDCYPSGTVALTQLGVLNDLSAAFA